jgi:predicted phage tail protein
VSFATTTPQFVAVGAPAGRFYVRVRALNPAGTGPASPDATLVVGAGGPLPDAPRSARAWMRGSQLMMTWDDPGSGGVPTHYLVEAGTGPGLANIASITSTRRGFTYTPVPAGFYFLRVRAVNATGASAPSNEVMLVVGGAASPPRAPRETGATAIGSTVTLNWSAPAGAVTGYVIEAGSAPGLSNLVVQPIASVTTVSFSSVPAGTYYVRIRAVNALGRSVASDELVIVVG